MKTIGLVGGLTWYSSVDYYRYINQAVNRRLGGDEAAQVIINSVNYGVIKKLTFLNDWDAIAAIICRAAEDLERAGADCVLLGANTMHHIAERVADAINIPFIHVADVTGDAILEKGLNTVALLGTKYTMQFSFYKEHLSAKGITTLIPEEADIEIVNDGIYLELGKGIILSETRKKYQDIIGKLIERGAQGVILGCTEIPLLIKPEDCPVPIFDTTLLHAEAAVQFALEESSALS